MASLDMGGPYPLTGESVERVCRAIGPGNYAVGEATEHSWVPRLIGRSDTDVKAAILALVGRPRSSRCPTR